MKELLIVRHAKSSWADAGLADHDRPLNDRGRRAAPEMGRRLAAPGPIPDRMVSSDARRARETVAALSAALGVPSERIEHDSSLYTAAAGDWLKRIRGLDDGLGCVLLVGHNPALHELVHLLTDLRKGRFPTAAVVYAALDIDRWRETMPGRARCLHYDDPKNPP